MSTESSHTDIQPRIHDHAAPVTPQFIFGVILMAVGVLFTLDNLGIGSAERYWRWWPAGLVALGVSKLWQSRGGISSPAAGIVLLLVGTWLLLHNFGYIRPQLWDVWPLLLVFIGTAIVYQGMRGRRDRARPSGGDTVSGVAILGGVKRRSTSRAFRGGEVTAILGGCEIDLRGAEVHGEAIMDLFAMWGGIELRVPENWTVVGNVTPFMGAVEDHTRPQTPAAHRLVLRGTAIMGGVQIKN